MKARLILPIVVVLLFFVSVMPVYAATTTVTWYYRSDTHTVNGVTGYIINQTLSATTKNVSLSLAGNSTVYWGWRVWQVKSDGSKVELSSGSPIATVNRAVDGEGFQTSTWTAPARALQIGFDALEIVLYMKVGAGSWQSRAIFVSSTLVEKSVSSVTWTFKAYTKRSYSGGTTTGYFIFGSSTRNSRIEGVTFGEADVYETMNYKLQSGDFIGFILYPYVNLIGNLFYGLVMLMLTVPLYNRYHSLTPILVLFILFGGATGIFTLLIPVAGFGITWVFMLLGLAGLLYKVFR